MVVKAYQALQKQPKMVFCAVLQKVLHDTRAAEYEQSVLRVLCEIFVDLSRRVNNANAPKLDYSSKLVFLVCV